MIIRQSDILPVASVNKAHGIHGELSVTIDPDIQLEVGTCLLRDVDGIYVPFYISRIRPRHGDTFLVGFDGVDTETEAADFVGETLYVLTSEIASLRRVGWDEDETEDDGFYASSLVGFTILSLEGEEIGAVADIDMTTSNTLLIVERPMGDTVMVPLADGLVSGYDPEGKTLTMDVPEGLLDL
ncbi:MAG: ribosome maturation factor RimM [Pseudoflavonifractor sp.]|nr:ribosome maturation factor RimM [Alloprevotella sp.]MCM1116267.1 ribosome maturation factor RimM [Pseudoflavonifractor sp.]